MPQELGFDVDAHVGQRIVDLMLQNIGARMHSMEMCVRFCDREKMGGRSSSGVYGWQDTPLLYAAERGLDDVVEKLMPYHAFCLG